MKIVTLILLATSTWSLVTPAVGHTTRQADSCGDPSLAVTFVEAYSTTLTSHNINYRADFVNADTIGTIDWQIQGEIFRAWKTPQPGTVPLYRMSLDTLASDIVLAVGSSSSTPPVVPGFPTNFGVVAYVYATQVCGSVPLYQLALPAKTDHWYTTEASERDALVGFGWTDQGIISYVLPIDLSYYYY